MMQPALTTVPMESTIKTTRTVFNHGYEPGITLSIGWKRATGFSIFQGSLAQESPR
jgi:hypothetical protein